MSERPDPRHRFDAALIPGMRGRLTEWYDRLRAVENAAMSAVGTAIEAAFFDRCCPGCGVLPGAQPPVVRAHGMDLIECGHCGLTYSRQVVSGDIEDVRNWLREIARATAQLHTAAPYSELEVARASYYLEKIERLSPSPGTLFEIGCGAGTFLVEAASRGWSALGSEPSDPMRATALDRGAQVTSLPFPECLRNPPTTFEVIAALDVLEHVAEPIPFLCSIRDRLAPEGLCVLQVPNWDSLLVRLEGATSSVICPGHWTFFSPTTLVGVALQAGLQVKRIETVVTEWDRIAAYPPPEIGAEVRRLRPNADVVGLNPSRLLDLGLGYKIFAIFSPLPRSGGAANEASADK